MLNAGSGKGSFFAEDTRVDGNHAPTEVDETPTQNNFLGNATDVRLGVRVLGGEKEKANPEVTVCEKLMAKFLDFAPKEFGGDLGEDAGAVSRFCVGIEGATVSELADAVEGAFKDGAGATALNIGNDSDPTSIVLMGGMIEPLGGGHGVVEGEPWHEISEYFRRELAQEWESS